MSLGTDTNLTRFCTIDDKEIGSLTFRDVGSTLVINLFVFVLLLIVFEHFRGKRSVYAVRECGWLPHRRPPPLPRGPLCWVWHLIRVPDEQILRLCGLDGFMLIRIIRLYLRVCLVGAFFGVVVLTPTYLHGHRDEASDGRLRSVLDDPGRITLGNIKDQKTYWVPVFFAYLTTLHVLYQLLSEYKAFLEWRLQFLSVGDPDVHIQKSFSVMVDRVPHNFQTNVALYRLVDELFPDEVHSAVIAFGIDKLENMVDRREWVVDLLEKAHARRSVKGREPMHFVPDDDRWWNWLLCRGQKVESVTYWQNELDYLNANITTEQVRLRREAEFVNRRAETQQAMIARQPKRPNGCDTFNVTPFLIGNAQSRANLMEQRFSPQERYCPINGGLQTTPDDVALVQMTSFRSIGSVTPPSSPKASPVSFDHVAHARQILRAEEEQNGDLPIPATSQNLCRKLLRALSVKAMRLWVRTVLTCFRATTEVGRAVSLLAPVGSGSSTGFITFKTLSSATIATQSLLTMEPFMFEISPAPEPRDIIWANVSNPLRRIQWRETAVAAIVIFLSIFWGALVSGLYKLQSLMQELQTRYNLSSMGTTGKFLFGLVSNYVPALLLLIILQLLPLFFWLSSRYYERLRTWSDIQASVMSRFFYYQMVNVYVTIVGGALLDEVLAIAKDPKIIFDVLGCQVPRVAVYFLQVIITKTFSANLWEFSRSWPLIRMLWMQTFTTYDRKTARQRRSGVYGPPTFWYAGAYPSLLLVFTLCCTYDVILPVMWIAGAVYFKFCEIIYKHHLLYIFVPAFESGGAFWHKVFTRTLVSLLLSHLTLFGYMLVLGASHIVPWLLPLPITLLAFYRHCCRGYEAPARQLSLLASRRIDAGLRDPGREPEGSPRRPATHRSHEKSYEIGAAKRGVGFTPSPRKGDQAEESPQDPMPSRPVRVKSDPLVVDYFQRSAYSQPSLTQGPQEAEALPWERRSRSVSHLPAPFRRAWSRSQAFLPMRHVADHEGSGQKQRQEEAGLREPLTRISEGGKDTSGDSGQTNGRCRTQGDAADEGEETAAVPDSVQRNEDRV